MNEPVTTVRPASTYAADKNPRNPSEARGGRDTRRTRRRRGEGGRVAPLIIAELRKGEMDRQTKESKKCEREKRSGGEGESARKRRGGRGRGTGKPGEILTTLLGSDHLGAV